MKRTETRALFVGNVQIGGQNKCVLQSMTNVPAKDVERSVAQINELAANGCELVRTAVLDPCLEVNTINLQEHIFDKVIQVQY